MKRLETRQTVGLGVATGIIVVVATLVGTLGIVPFPDTPLLADQPEPALPGRIAYVDWDGGDACIHVVDGIGNDVELRCDPGYGGRLTWTDDGYIGLETWSGGASELQLVDPATGQVVGIRPLEPGDLEAPRPEEPVDEFGTSATRADGTSARTHASSGAVSISVGRAGEDREVIWEATGPRTYRLDQISWSPDGAWLLVRDSRDALLVLGEDGTPAPRIWVEDIGWDYAWYIRDASS